MRATTGKDTARASTAACRRRLQRLCAQVGAAGSGSAASAGATRGTTGVFGDEFSGAPIRDEYDYVVVGGGTAGCCMAARLSEDPSVTVLLLEAGGSNDTDMTVGILGQLGNLQRNDQTDWQFTASGGPDMHGRELFIPRGKLLGGCSSINAGAFVRGHPENFNGWARAGCEGWSYAEVLPYFRKLEDFEPGSKSEERGKGGPVSVTDPVTNGAIHPLSVQFIKACRELGLPVGADYNTSDADVFGPQQANVRNGWRHSTAAAYLRADTCGGDGRVGGVPASVPRRPAHQRPNLTVATYCHVTKVVTQGRRAVGVRFKRGSIDIAKLRDTPELVVGAKKEVVLCAGAIGSPWILMLSGIGPAAHLREHGIEVVADLPVGQNLQDHLFTPLLFTTTDKADPLSADMSLSKLKTMFNFFVRGTGAGMSSPLQVTGFVKTSLPKHADDHAPDAPDLQMFFTPFVSNAEYLRKSNVLGTGTHTREDNIPKFGFSVLPTLLRPRSRGSVTLKSSDPLTYPHIEFNFFSDKRDMEVIVEGMRLARKLVATSAFKGLVESEHMDEANPHPPASDEYIREYIRRTTITVYHPVGTCRMGRVGDATTVVDPRCRVVGVKGLRVVDAAAMPFVISGNTCAPVIMMAEKAADMIKEDA